MAAGSEPNLDDDFDKRPAKRQRLTRGDGQKAVSYDMKHHPMDEILRPKYSAKRRRIREEVLEEFGNTNGGIDDDDDDDDIDDDDDDDDNDDNDDNDHTAAAIESKAFSANPYRRRSSREIHRSETPYYSAKWHPMDQLLKNNVSPISRSKQSDHSRRVRKDFSESPPPLMDGQKSTTAKSNLESDEKFNRDSDVEGDTSPNQRRSARISSDKVPPNYDMKYGEPVRR